MHVARERRAPAPGDPELEPRRAKAPRTPMRAILLAERVIRAASRRNPADAVLRQTLKSERGLSREAASFVSRAVFAYYRWRGWLDQHEPLCVQIETALDLA